MILVFFLQVESDGSRSGSSLSLRTVLPSSAGGTAPAGAANNNNGTTTSHSPQHATSGRTTVTGGTGHAGASDGNHRGVQRSISASSSSKPRRGSTGAENNNAVICESQTTSQVATSPSQSHPKSHKANQVVLHKAENEAEAVIQGGIYNITNQTN